MRDRRNTGLSVSSNGSSADHSDLESIDLNLNEKSRWIHFATSPILPMPVTGGSPGSKKTTNRSWVAKALATVCVLVIIWQCFFSWRVLSSSGKRTKSGVALGTHELLVANELPDHPTALIIDDYKGSARWAISIPHNRRFPLTGQEYRDMCMHGEMLHDQIAKSQASTPSKHWLHRKTHYGYDANYIQVDDAIKSGALPKSRRENVHDVCEKSLTFVLGRDDASFGKSLLLLWMSYGLAKKEGRAFFIDDSQWAWGRYSSYFLPAPSSACMKPPPHHIVPCPHNAKHLVVSTATAEWTFGSDFEAYFTSSTSRGLAKHSRIYKLLRTGYTDLFKLADEDRHYVDGRVAKLAADSVTQQEPVVAMQIRRGDLHPFEYQYNMDYLPLERYLDGVRAYMQRHHPTVAAHPPSAAASSSSSLLKSPLVLATDDPEIFTSPDLRHALDTLRVQHAQERILLATKATLDRTVPPVPADPGSALVKHLDHNSGWEGGFYSSLFFTLGSGRGDVVTTVMTDEALRLREFVGRAYLMDLAVVSRADGVVCAVSSASCRALGVMMGWDALKQGRWVNVDDTRIWSWDGRKA